MTVAGPEMVDAADLSLFAALDGQKRDALWGSPMSGLLPGEVIADLFCGAGGWGEGLRGSLHGVSFAVNHSPAAIATHQTNNPGCAHHMGDAWKARPRDVVRGTLGVLFASAACTTHSRARGSAPISQRVHMLGWCIARWMKELAPRVVFIENVPEWKDWGPTFVDSNGVRRQNPARKGQHFRRWWRYCERLGYRMEMRVLDAPDYGAACRRRRLFIVARRDGQPIVWPAPTHRARKDERVNAEDQVRRTADRGGRGRAAEGAQGGVQRFQQHRAASDVIDWTDLGHSIFARSRPLKPKTLGRIAEGVRRYVLNDPAPFVLRVTHGDGRGWHVCPIDGPLPTQTTRQDLGVCVPIVAPQNGGVYGQRVDEAGPTITTKGHQALISPVLHAIRGDVKGRDVRELMPTITAGNGPGRGAGAGHALGLATPVLATTGYGERDGQAARAHAVGELLGTPVNGVKQGLVTPVLMNNTSHHTGGRVGSPLPTVTTGGQTGLVAPVLSYMRHGGGQHSDARDPMLGMTAGGTHAGLVAALLVEYYTSGSGKSGRRVSEPMGAIPTVDRHGLVCVVIAGVEWVIVDILFRMLRPAELAKAMGFRDDFVWPPTGSSPKETRLTRR